MRYLTVDSNSNASLPRQGVNNLTLLKFYGQAIQIGNEAVVFKRSLTATPSPSSPRDPIEGQWPSYKYEGTEEGPITIIYNGTDNGTKNYYIDGVNIRNDRLRYLSVDSNSNASLPLQGVNNFGTVVSVYGQPIQIGRIGNEVVFKRPLTATPSPSSPRDPVEGQWTSYKYGGMEFGPVTISYNGTDNGTKIYYINGGNIPNNNLRSLTVDSNSNASLPLQRVNNFGTVLLYNDTTATQIGSINSVVIFRR